MADTLPSPSPSLSSADSDSATSDTPPYTPEELAAIFLDFYGFLTTIHYNPADLKIPPSDGWPGLTSELCPGAKSDFEFEVLRRLPYFKSGTAYIHYKSRLIDYTSSPHQYLENQDFREEGLGLWFEDGEFDLNYVYCIAEGHESGGRELFLDTKHGQIIENMIRMQTLDPQDVESYFDELKQAYRSLKLIPCLGRLTIEADNVDERVQQISEEQVRSQTEEWGTDLDVQYIRQIYRQHGWPDSFRRDDAMEAVNQLLESMGEHRGGWEKDFSFDDGS